MEVPVSNWNPYIVTNGPIKKQMSQPDHIRQSPTPVDYPALTAITAPSNVGFSRHGKSHFVFFGRMKTIDVGYFHIGNHIMS